MDANGGNYGGKPKPKTSILDRMSMSFYVTNFPHHVTNKDLWDKCSAWGTVVDVFIANRLSKAGKRFAFVRFIKVSDANLLLSNLNSMWIAKYKLYADVVRFNRSFNNRIPASTKGDNPPAKVPGPRTTTVSNEKSYAAAASVSNVNIYAPIKRRIVKVRSIP